MNESAREAAEAVPAGRERLQQITRHVVGLESGGWSGQERAARSPRAQGRGPQRWASEINVLVHEMES
jgi:hypothetical protein